MSYCHGVERSYSGCVSQICQRIPIYFIMVYATDLVYITALDIPIAVVYIRNNGTEYIYSVITVVMTRMRHAHMIRGVGELAATIHSCFEQNPQTYKNERVNKHMIY